MEKYIERAIELLQEFCVNEYGEKLQEEDLKDFEQEGINYGTLKVQAYANLVTKN